MAFALRRSRDRVCAQAGLSTSRLTAPIAATCATDPARTGRPASVIRPSAVASARSAQANPTPASSVAASWTPISNRRKNRSCAPGIRSASEPNVARPEDRSRHASNASTSARSAGDRRQRTNASASPTAAKTVTTGNRPSSSSLPVASHPSIRGSP